MFVSSGTMTGPIHIAKGFPNQDAYNVLTNEEMGLTVVSLADGAGSLERSDLGAQKATEESCKFVESLYQNDIFLNAQSPIYTSQSSQKFSRNYLSSIVESAMWKTVEVIQSEEDREIGSTLVLFAVDKNFWACCVVGDSFAVIHTKEDHYELLTSPTVGEFANITQLLTSRNIEVTTFEGRREEISGFALSSDGLEFVGVTKNVGPAPQFWNGVFSRVHYGNFSVEGFLNFLLSKGKIEDDTTLIAVSVNEEEEEDDAL